MKKLVVKIETENEIQFVDFNLINKAIEYAEQYQNHLTKREQENHKIKVVEIDENTDEYNVYWESLTPSQYNELDEYVFNSLVESEKQSDIYIANHCVDLIRNWLMSENIRCNDMQVDALYDKILDEYNNYKD